MNFLQMQNEVLGAFRQPLSDTHRRQHARTVVNRAISAILSKRANWSFLYDSVDITTVANAAQYALPLDLASLSVARYNGVKMQMFSPENTDGHQNSSNASMYSATIRKLTKSPFANVGFVFPQFNSEFITGLGTSFTTSMVNRFFRAGDDAEIYRVKAVNSTTEIQLWQKYTGRTQAGTVSVYATSLTTVYGSPNITNFRKEQIGRMIRIANANYQIADVDVDRQVITVATNIATTGTGLSFGIQDNYQIDPPQVYILEIYPSAATSADTVQVDYYSFQTPLTGDNDVPKIPPRYDHVIMALACLMWGATEGTEMQDLAVFSGVYKDGIQDMLVNEDPLNMAFDYSSEPDVVRLANTSLTR